MEFKNDDKEMKRIYYASLHPDDVENTKYGKSQNQILTTHRQDVKERTDTFNDNNSKSKFNAIEDIKESFENTINTFFGIPKDAKKRSQEAEQDMQKVLNSYSNKQKK